MEQPNTPAAIPRQTLTRLPRYLNYLHGLDPVPEYISATAIADDMGLGNVQVRKDLACVASGGKPKRGYKTTELIACLENFLGCSDTVSAVIVGAGKIGRALLTYERFEELGLHVIAAFDENLDAAAEEDGKPIFPIEKLEDLCRRLNVHIGIITTSAGNAQNACDRLIAGGVRAVWNFAPVHLKVPDDIILQNEDLASSLLLLSRRLSTVL
ncbi:MAG: redox-sensing transcriptional repressor Rex [Clostridia bacterium]|nr:redox-sensing transcriptional repressor Rex [Clostridia bacterium]